LLIGKVKRLIIGLGGVFKASFPYRNFLEA